MRLKVLCLNLWLGGTLFDAIIEFLKKEQPDILLAQEVYNSQDSKLGKRFRSVEVIKQELVYPYHDFASAFIDYQPEGKILSGNAVFSKWPILSNQTLFYDIPFGDRLTDEPQTRYVIPRNLEQVVIETSGNRLNVFNTQGIWGEDGDDNERRLKMGKTIVKQIQGRDNVILAGDFNVQPNTQAIGQIERHLTNVFKNELISTFNMAHKPAKSGYATAVVDMMFISPNIKVVDHYCPKVNVSDHLPLVVTLEIG